MTLRKKIGIFWFFKCKSIIASVPLEEGTDDGTFINGIYDHIDFWSIVKIKHPELRFFEYEDVPRGIVLFSKKENIFFIYMDKTLLNQKNKDIIMNEFNLNDSRTRFMTDIHYTTDEQELERLFNDK